jgi:hypothetical protein
MTAQTITLIVPYGRRPLRIELPAEAARWLRDELIEAIGSQKLRRRPRIRRGLWQPPRRSR